MSDTTTTIYQNLKDCNLSALFIEELGWNYHRAKPLIVENDGVNYTLNAIAEKHGMVAYECQPDPKGQIPDYPTRGKIERQVAKSAHEHIVVFINHDKTMQTWQWVRREKDKPTARREHIYVCSQPGDSLIQKLQNLRISLEEEEKLTIVDVTGKVRQAFDVDRVTKRFYDQFKDEHKAFLSFIDGITALADREWYASLMLNRLMFIYFIQKKAFLDGDIHYLRNRLQMVRKSQGNDKFHSFYRQFLRRLFHEGLAQRKEDRKSDLNTLLGEVPYLNGGLFDTHQLENDNPEIQIPDEAFARLFNFFDEWEWHLDARIDRPDKEINPDVLGYIFEKYINNQSQMGAYYTKEDITEYISKNTIVPFFFGAAEKKCAIAFRSEGAVWRLLRDDPNRYIFDTVKKGVDLQLPEDIAAGITDVSKRGGWNRLADYDFALRTETWREHITRRTHYLEVKAKMATGEIRSINDLITYNLDLRQFAQDVIETCEGPELLRAFYQSIAEVSVLDPTCGSGAFLFAALNILEPLYEACLERMEVFVGEMDKSGEKHHPEKYSDFRKVLEHANDQTKHPSLRYFILKSIVLKNLYGVDIMAEAVEICKLRLFLKLVAQVEHVEDVEPLPDIDFNIRSGNTLVGFASLDSLRRAMTIRPDGRYRMVMPEDESTLKRIDKSAELAGNAFHRFREEQTDLGMQANRYSTTKSDLLTQLAALRAELDHYLATEYGIDYIKRADFERWHTNHKPFHWFVEFYGLMSAGGFDIIIGNPPYVEYKDISETYQIKGGLTELCKNLFAFIAERNLLLSHRSSRIGMIIPVSAFSTDRMIPLIKLMKEQSTLLHVANFSWRPGKLFDGVNLQLSIYLQEVGLPKPNIFTTKYILWDSEARPELFSQIYFAPSEDERLQGAIPKLGCIEATSVLNKIRNEKAEIGACIVGHSSNQVYYRRGGLYWKVFLDFITDSSEEKIICVNQDIDKYIVIATLSSNLWFWYLMVTSDCRHLGNRDIDTFPFDFNRMDPEIKNELANLGRYYVNDLKKNARSKVRVYKGKKKVSVLAFSVKESKSTIDKIDRVLAKYYGFTEKELDFIINYDIKYRMGADNGEEDI